MRKKIEKCTINMPLPVELVAALQEIREKTHVPMNFTIEKALRKYLYGENKPDANNPGGIAYGLESDLY